MEEFANLQSKHTFDQEALQAHHRGEYVTEKERMSTAEQALKILEMQGENAIQIKKIQAHHRSQMRHMQRAQHNRLEKRIKRWSSILGRNLAAEKKFGSGASSVGSKSQSESQSMRILLDLPFYILQGSGLFLLAVNRVLARVFCIVDVQERC